MGGWVGGWCWEMVGLFQHQAPSSPRGTDSGTLSLHCEMCHFVGADMQTCLIIDASNFRHLLNTEEAADFINAQHIGTHRDALTKMMQGDANRGAMRRALQDVHRKLYPEVVLGEVAGPRSNGADILVYCKWGKHRMVVVVVVVVVLVLLLVVVVVVVVLWWWWWWWWWWWLWWWWWW